jgi:hypothetical protein
VNGMRFVLAWIGAGVTAALVLVWVFPHAYPLFPREWEISKREAQAIGLERLRDLGELPRNPYIVTRLSEAGALEQRLQNHYEDLQEARWSESALIKSLLAWEVAVWEPGARAQEWSHHARIAPDGEVLELLLRLPTDQEGGEIPTEEARRVADLFLEDQGFDLTRYDEPELRTRDLQTRTDLFLRYLDREALLGEEYPYGVEVVFSGDRLAGYSRYFDDPELMAIRQSFRPIQLLVQAKVFLPLILLPLIAIPFVRRYHAGEIGVRRGIQISIVIVACGVVSMLFGAGDAAAGAALGVLSRKQASLVVGLQMIILLFVPMGLLSFLSWSVGESLSRERHGNRLAAFDALFQGQWANATFARASLRGFSAGLMVAAGLWTLLALLRGLGVRAFGWLLIGPWWESASFFSVPLLAYFLAFSLYAGLFGRLFVISYWEKLIGVWAAVAVSAVVAVVLFFGSSYVYPFAWNLVIWSVPPIAYIFLFLRYGIFTSILASFTASIAMSVVPFLSASDPSIQLQASLGLLGVAMPLLVSARSLLSDEEFVYRYDDVPPHVRRIAERERQRIELETARGIQASILPNLPPELGGVGLSHRYLPATEVGGDFYDVLALKDGRLAVAVGDVAGHGVSSGLVMSMVKSALTVQVDFDPEVESVFATLNRMVHQSAGKRLLATLCYALIDPSCRRMDFASAGHLFPYRLTRTGEVQALESVSYPLGVRANLDVKVQRAALESRDILILFSDGIVEAHAENRDEVYGFDRLEQSLGQCLGQSVDQICETVLQDVRSFTNGAPPEDDLTILVLQIP